MSATKFSLSGSVGQGGANRPDDTKVVQHLINLAKIRMNDYPLITVDGKSGNETIGAIRQFQQRMFGASDGRVDIGGRSIDALLKIHAEEPLRNP